MTFPAPISTATDLSSPPQPPIVADFLPRFEDRTLVRYLRDVHDWHGYVKFLGLPSLKDTGRDVPLDALFVEPNLSTERIAPEAMDGSVKIPEPLTVLDALRASPRLVILGDPGSGKSTLINWVCESLSNPRPSALVQAIGELVPLPIVLRELRLTPELTWDSLLASFLNHPVAAELQHKPKLVKQLLESGQAFVLLDGLDEISSLTLRASLQSAVFDAFRRFPSVRWIMTSRVVGYEDVPFDRRMIGARRAEGREDLDILPNLVGGGLETYFASSATKRTPLFVGLADILYTAPFNDEQIKTFAQHWHHHREPAPRKAAADAAQFVECVFANPGTHTLSRIPNLLTFMALIHRQFADLPNGRALLYAKIAEAYLESIDGLRKVQPLHAYSLAEKKAWLGYVAFRMQSQRFASWKKSKRKSSEKESSAPGEVLVDEQALQQWLVEAMGDKYPAADAAQEAEQFLNAIARRSGLLLPRGEGRYAFLHLSFQEYFAAIHIQSCLEHVTWRDGARAQRKLGITAQHLRSFTKARLWQDTFIFLFELLDPTRGWPEFLAKTLFPKATDPLNESERTLDLEKSSRTLDGPPQEALLMAAVSVDPHSGLSPKDRSALWGRCWLAHLQSWMWESAIPSILLQTGPFQARVFEPLMSFHRLIHLNLSPTPQLTSLEPISALHDLVVLNISSAAISDLTPLTRLKHLQSLYLASNSGLSDLSPLTKLLKLNSLGLSGCSEVANFRILTALSGLTSLHLDYQFIEKVSGGLNGAELCKSETACVAK